MCNSNSNSDGPFDDAPVVFRYTRVQALEDGVLVDLSQWAAEAAFVIPVACTSAVWHQLIVPPEKTRELGQSERGRAHDLMRMLYNAIKRQTQRDSVLFKVVFLKSRNRQEMVRLKAVIGPGDNAEPVITIMEPDED
jgi:hypothetical protein